MQLNIQRTESSRASGDCISAAISVPLDIASNPNRWIQSRKFDGAENTAL